MTITENRTFPIAPDTHEDRSATLAARILRAGGPLTESEARPVTVHTLPGFTSNSDATITGNLIRVDRMDPHLTFLIRSTNNVSFWAYEVEPMATRSRLAVGDIVEYVTAMTFAPVGTRARVTQISGGDYIGEVSLTLTSGDYSGQRKVSPVSALRKVEPEPIEAIEADDLTVESITALRAQIAELQRVNDNQRTLVAREVERMETFKMRVAEKMADLAEEHEWCDVARQGLEDLGMEWPDRSKSFEVTVRFTVTASTGSSRPTTDFVRQSLSINTNEESGADNGEGLSIEMDSDWSNVNMSSVRIVDIDRVED